MVQSFRTAVQAQLLRKVFDIGGHGLTPALARDILSLDFPERDADRLRELSAKANDGMLSESEEAELEAYVDVSDLLAFWQSRARQTVQQEA